MSATLERDLSIFVDWAKRLKGDEKGEAQIFLEHLFRGFGHASLPESGVILEHRVKGRKGTTQFADLVWRPRVVLEMKARGERLERHYHQAFEYWLHLVPNRPRYVVLCNFDELWVYDFDQQLDEPMDRVKLAELPTRWNALAFLLPVEQRPLFGNDRVAVSRAAADKVARVFNSLIRRGEDREPAQRFILQCVVALFSEDFGLLPRGLFTQVLRDCRDGEASYDLIGGLFRQMNDPSQARGGRFREVPYFNGGLFAKVEPIVYLPFGEEIQPLLDFSTHMFTGHERDRETGLDYMMARYYGSSLSRFLSTDPIGGGPGNPQSWNRYTYTLNNPLNLVDRNGKCSSPAGGNGVCIDAFVAAPRIGVVGFGDNRGFSATNASLTSKVEGKIAADPTTGRFDVETTAGFSSVFVEGVGRRGSATTSITNGQTLADGTMQFTVETTATNGFGTMVLDSIDMSINMEIAPDGTASIQPGSVADGFPSIEIYGYSEGQAQALFLGDEGTTADLAEPLEREIPATEPKAP